MAKYPLTTGTGPQRILDSGISRMAVNAVVVTSVMTALAMGLAFTRFAIRRKTGWGIDDTVLAISLAFLIGQLIGQYLLAFYAGEGWDMADMMIYPFKITRTLQLIYWPSLSYGVVVGLIKTSILFSYKRIFGHVKYIRISIWVLLVLSWAWSLSSSFGMAFQCDPIRKAWHPEIDGTCIDLIAFLWGNSTSNMAIDWLILAVPIVPVLKLQLPTVKKVLVGGAFLCGSLACIASTMRAVTTKDFDPEDLGVTVYHASIWIYIEPPMAVISSCLPFLSGILGAKAMRGVKNLTSLRSSAKRTDKSGMSSFGSSNNGGAGFRSMDSSSEETNRHWADQSERTLHPEPDHHNTDSWNIRKTTTTMVHGQSVNGGPGFDTYDYKTSGALDPTMGLDSSPYEASVQGPASIGRTVSPLSSEFAPSEARSSVRRKPTPDEASASEPAPTEARSPTRMKPTPEEASASEPAPSSRIELTPWVFSMNGSAIPTEKLGARTPPV